MWRSPVSLTRYLPPNVLFWHWSHSLSRQKFLTIFHVFLFSITWAPWHCLLVAVAFGIGKDKVSQNPEATGTLQRWQGGICKQVTFLKSIQFSEFSPEIKMHAMRCTKSNPLATNGNIYSFRSLKTIWQKCLHLPVCHLGTWTIQTIILNLEVNLRLSNELSSQDREVLRPPPPPARVDEFHIVFTAKVT